MLEKQEFRYHRAHSRNEEHDAGKDKRILAPPVRRHIARNGTTDDTAYQRAGTGKAVPPVRIHKIIRP